MRWLRFVVFLLLLSTSYEAGTAEKGPFVGSVDVVHTIADLRQGTGVPGQSIFLQAHSFPGDGGFGHFHWESGRTRGGFVDNNGSIIVPAGGLGSEAWVRDFSGPVNVRWFGARGDGKTDDWGAFKGAIETTIDSGKNVLSSLYVPEGRYLINTNNGSLRLPEGMVLWGDGGLQVHNLWARQQGATLMIKGTKNSPFIVNRGCRVRGLSIVYPDQAMNTRTPVEYPHCFASGPDGMGRSFFEDLLFTNCYRGFKSGDLDAGIPGGGLFMKNVYGMFFREFVRIENSFALSQISNVGVSELFAPGGDKDSRDYAGANLTLFALNGSADGLTVEGGLFFRANKLIEHTRTSGAPRAMNFARFTNVTCDGLRHGYTSANDAAILSLSFHGCFFRLQDVSDGSIAPYAFDFTWEKGPAKQTDRTVQFDACRFRAARGTVIRVGAGSEPLENLIVSDCQFYDWGTGANAAIGVPAIVVDNPATDVDISGSSFDNVSAAAKQPRAVYLPRFRYGKVVDSSASGCQDAFLFGTGRGLVFSHNRTNDSTRVGADIYGSIPSVVWNNNTLDINPLHAKTTRPSFSAQSDTGQKFNSTEAAGVTFNVAVFDRGKDYDNASHVFTAPVAGEYIFDATISHDASGTAGDVWEMRLDTTSRSFVHSYVMPGGRQGSIAISCIAQMNRGDTARIRVARAHGAGQLVLMNDRAKNWFNCRLLE